MSNFLNISIHTKNQMNIAYIPVSHITGISLPVNHLTEPKSGKHLKTTEKT